MITRCINTYKTFQCFESDTGIFKFQHKLSTCVLIVYCMQKQQQQFAVLYPAMPVSLSCSKMCQWMFTCAVLLIWTTHCFGQLSSTGFSNSTLSEEAFIHENGEHYNRNGSAQEMLECSKSWSQDTNILLYKMFSCGKNNSLSICATVNKNGMIEAGKCISIPCKLIFLRRSLNYVWCI